MSADADHGYVDGLRVDLDTAWTASDPSVGYSGGVEVALGKRIELIDRDHWDQCHPGVEPTPEAMLALVRTAETLIHEAVEDYCARNPSEPDFDDDSADDGGDDY